MKGGKWDNCNSIIDKIYFKKRNLLLWSSYIHLPQVMPVLRLTVEEGGQEAGPLTSACSLFSPLHILKNSSFCLCCQLFSEVCKKEFQLKYILNLQKYAFSSSD